MAMVGIACCRGSAWIGAGRGTTRGLHPHGIVCLVRRARWWRSRREAQASVKPSPRLVGLGTNGQGHADHALNVCAVAVRRSRAWRSAHCELPIASDSEHTFPRHTKSGGAPMSNIDRQRIDAVRIVERLGYTYTGLSGCRRLERLQRRHRLSRRLMPCTPRPQAGRLHRRLRRGD
jgi:hypothetical protein